MRVHVGLVVGLEVGVVIGSVVGATVGKLKEFGVVEKQLKYAGSISVYILRSSAENKTLPSRVYLENV